jgi:hypothetical protein
MLIANAEVESNKTYLEFLNNKYIEIDLENKENIQAVENTFAYPKEFTTSRQVLAVHYLMEELNVYGNTDKTEVARFIQFLTGKETGTAKISDTTIYKKLKSPLSKSDKNIEEDLRFVRTYFEKLGLTKISERINKEISSKR